MPGKKYKTKDVLVSRTLKNFKRYNIIHQLGFLLRKEWRVGRPPKPVEQIKHLKRVFFVFISQTTDFHFVSFHSISFRFVSLHFVSQTTVSPGQPQRGWPGLQMTELVQ